MLKYISQFFLQIFPSVVATVVGAYIVNYYIIPKSQPDAPKAAAYSKATPGDDQGAIDVTPKPDAVVPDVKTPDAKTQDAKTPEAKAPDVKSKAADSKPAETAKAAAETKRAASREKAIAKATPTPPAAETASLGTPASDERRDRDANELARAVIERLRASGEPPRAADAPSRGPEHVQEAVREPVRDAARDPVPPREPVRVNIVSVPPAPPHLAVPPLPPPVNVAAPGGETIPAARPPYAPAPQRAADANRLIPPADIPPADIPPSSRPLDLEAAATPPRPSVADDVLSAARSVIHAVVPQ